MSVLDVPTEMDLPNVDVRRAALLAELSHPAPDRRWRRLVALGTAAAAAASFTLLVTHGSDGGQVLAYEIAAGDSYTYRYASHDLTDHYELADNGDRTPRGGVDHTIDGSLSYTVSAGSASGTFVVEIRPDITAGESEDGVEFHHGEDLWPDLTVTVDDTGAFLGAPEGEGEDGIAAAMFPGPAVFSERVGPPFSFGPPLPAGAVEVGDSWTTEEPSVSCVEQPCPPRIGQHRIVRVEAVGGRSTWVIESSYSEFASLTTWGDTTQGEFTNTSTVWFDPDAGIVVRADHHAELHLRRPLNDGSGITMATDRTIDTSIELTS